MLKRQGFIYGAIILIVANAISKILGAVFKIPLTYILHEDGMGIFNSAFTVYVMGLSFVTAGFPLAVSKGISAAVESGDLKKTVVISKTASYLAWNNRRCSFVFWSGVFCLCYKRARC